MDKYKKLLSNTLIMTIGKFASKFLVYFLMPLYTSILSKEQYGTADLITNACNLLIPFCCIGITHGIFRFSADKNEDNKTIFSSGVIVLLASSAVFLLASPLIALVPYFESYAVLIVVYVISSNFHTLCAEYIRAKGHTKLFALQGIIGTALTIAFNLLFLIPMKLGVVGYVLSVAVADAVGTVLLIMTAKLYRDFSFKAVSVPKIKEMLRYSLPMMPTTIIWWVTNVSDRFVVTYICGSGENGLYSAAYKIPTILSLVAGVFIDAWNISAISDTDEGNDEENARFFSKVFAPYQAILFIGAALIIPFSKLGAHLLFDDSYFRAWTFIPVLMVATVFSSLTSFVGTIYTVKKRTMMSMLTAAFGAGLNIVLNFLMIPSMGAQGAGIATAISYFATFIFRAAHSRKYIAFDLKAMTVAINTGILLLQVVFMVLALPYNYLVQALLIAVLCAINARSLYAAVFGLAKKILKK